MDKCLKINFRRNFFERYRISDENAVKPQKFSDCAKMFNDCKEAEKYNNIEEEDDGDDKETVNEVDIKGEDGNEVEESVQMEKIQTQEKVAEEVTTEHNSENDTPKRKAKLINWQ